MIGMTSKRLQHLWHIVREYGIDFFDLFNPQLCASCDAYLIRGEEDLCLQCIHKLPKTYFWTYDINPVEQLFHGRLKIDGGCSFVHFTKGGHVQHMLHRLKYKGHREVGTKLGTLFAQQLVTKNMFSDIEIFIPVPLHFTREKQRGYNQSMVIARAMAEVYGKRVIGDNLVRTSATDTQTKKSRFDRSDNVKSVFDCKHPEKLRGMRVMLVDDVVTTGSTLEACAKILLNAGVSKLYIVAIASP